MARNCQVCGYKNPDGVKFCEDCGNDLETNVSVSSVPSSQGDTNHSLIIEKESISETVNQVLEPKEYPQSDDKLTPAKLISKSANPNSPTLEFILNESPLVVGQFDPDAGPVDIDLGDFSDANYISRNHAEIYYENGSWRVKDTNSVNGVFIKKPGQAKFSKVIDFAELNSNDEVFFAKIRFIFQTS